VLALSRRELSDYRGRTVAKRFAAAAHVEQATYRCPYQAHAPFAPNCALAEVGPDGALVMSSTQDIYNSRNMLARVLGLPVEKVRVQYYEGSGTFGHSCYEDAAQAAAILSQAVGRPVRVQFMRWDEHGWDNYGPAHVAEVRAAIDGAAPAEPSTGAGEEVMGATAAAIANALFDATGVRVRQYPLTPERVRAALKA
jgi:CO/xanthine dehydrogenase Mo-binding subunit